MIVFKSVGRTILDAVKEQQARIKKAQSHRRTRPDFQKSKPPNPIKLLRSRFRSMFYRG